MKKLFSLFQNNRRQLGFGIIHAFFAGTGQTFLIALFVPSFQSEFDLSSTQFGLLYSAATMVNALLLGWIGAWLDTSKLTHFSLGAAGLLILSLAGAAMSGSAWQLFIFLIGIRLGGQGLFTHIAAATTARVFGRDRGKALAVSGLGHPLGEAILAPVLAMILTYKDYHYGLWFLALSLLVIHTPLMLFCAKALPESPHFDKFKANKKSDTQPSTVLRRYFLKQPLFWQLLPGMVLPAFLLTGLFLHQARISEYKEWDPNWLAICFTTFAISRIGGSLLAGPLIDALGARRLFPYALLPLTFGITTLVAFDSLWIAFVYLAGAGLSIGSNSTIKSALMAEVFGSDSMGTIRSLYATSVAAATAISPFVFGWLLDRNLTLHLLSGSILAGLLTTLISLYTLRKAKC